MSDRASANKAVNEKGNKLKKIKRFFRLEQIHIVVSKTNEYAKMQGATVELSAFMGLHVVFSVVYFPSYKQAWKTKWLISFRAVPDIMTCSRSKNIQRYFHCTTHETTLLVASQIMRHYATSDGSWTSC